MAAEESLLWKQEEEAAWRVLEFYSGIGGMVILLSTLLNTTPPPPGTPTFSLYNNRNFGMGFTFTEIFNHQGWC